MLKGFDFVSTLDYDTISIRLVVVTVSSFELLVRPISSSTGANFAVSDALHRRRTVAHHATVRNRNVGGIK